MSKISEKKKREIKKIRFVETVEYDDEPEYS
jgi:hypothetical protein